MDMPVKTFAAILVACLALVYVVLFRKDCHDFRASILSHLGTRTPYRFVQNLDVSEIHYPGCEPLKMWSMIRHGSRKANVKHIEGYREKLEALREKILLCLSQKKCGLCGDLKDDFENWQLGEVDRITSMDLVHEGEDEMLLLGERMQMRFPSILPETYSRDIYKFRYTATQRTQASAEQFSIGLFGRRESHRVVYPNPMHVDPLLRFYKLCDKWKEDVKKSGSCKIEGNKFANSKAMNKVMNKMKKRLHLDSITFDELSTMYQVCGFETAANRTHISPWCRVFDDEDIEVLEYSEDLKYYWRDGHGFDLNHEQACISYQDMVAHFQSDEPTKSVFYFSHSGTLLKMLSYLNLYEDELPLLSDNFDKQSNRLWRVSQIDAFGTNIAFVLYRCGDELKVLTLHQEKPVTIPNCSDEDDLCPLDFFLEKLEECNFESLCSIS
ncbi:multiple inositol polyphosphate phosphatase 1 isoform X1 [Nilaparvata lugens]|uniref:multiple inositol polyphosphate phosphatase 1 isoform X1 n=1 Tax=Nilaparvata lugens TaxID=108931 RepID=UPI00193DBA87|nr:multiple inositol polyphosphate phosphatase 1 isoform X1 [Nilaparvata lugens]XP_039292071.1 multiple inositol polyphosphate phosphatase 1 isoform X1 [Nilaparvata lugens]